MVSELGGMGVIKNSINKDNKPLKKLKKKVCKARKCNGHCECGAGQAGILGSLTAKKYGLSSIPLEQNSHGTVSFQSQKL